jgi:hypothetical protein
MDGNTLNTVIGIMNERADRLIDLAKMFEKNGDADLAENYRARAWELVLTMEAIERAHAETPSSKAA